MSWLVPAPRMRVVCGGAALLVWVTCFRDVRHTLGHPFLKHCTGVAAADLDQLHQQLCVS